MTKNMFSSAMAMIVEDGVMSKSQTGFINAVFWMLNATASIGNVLASYVFAKMSEYMPWETVAVCWVSMIAVCLILCAVILPRWIKFKK